MKRILFFIVLFFFGFFSVLFYDRWHEDTTIKQAKKEVPILSEKNTFSLDVAPSESLKATMVSLSGDVLWESRTATEPAKLTATRSLQQGESLKTGENSGVELSFSDKMTMTLNGNTSVSLIQTLPQNIVVAQKKGSVRYQKTTPTPLSVRAMHLLTSQDNPGDILISVNPDEGTVTVAVTSGSVTLAFNSLDNIAQRLLLGAGQKYIFDDETREGSVK